mgnify:CR=1 FL=1
MPKNSTNMQGLLDDVLSSRPSTSDGVGIYDWVSEEPLGGSVASNTHLINREFDPIRKLLDEHNVFPTNYPDKKKTKAASQYFLYRKINTDQARTRFSSYFKMYLEHVLGIFSDLEVKYPHLRRYFTDDPLGHAHYDISDVNMYVNAEKMVKARHHNDSVRAKAASAATASARAADASSAEAASSAALSSPRAKKRSKSSKKKGGARGKDPTAPTPLDDGPAGASASAATPVSPPGALVPMPAEILTQFALQLKRMQNELYLYLRASLIRFADDLTYGVVTDAIAKYEQQKSLADRKRVVLPTRYPWARIQRLVINRCCNETTGGYYFNALYTTFRQADTLVHKWCTQVTSVAETLQAFGKKWPKAAARDTVKRLTSFLSSKEKEVIEDHLKDNAMIVWRKHKKSLRNYFKRVDLDTLVTLIRSIDVDMFPQKFNPVKHSPDAMYGTLFEYKDMVAARSKADSRVDAAIRRAERAERACGAPSGSSLSLIERETNSEKGTSQTKTAKKPSEFTKGRKGPSPLARNVNQL